MTELVLADPEVVEQTADPAAYVALAVERAKTWLAQALEHGEIDQIVELKSRAEAIRVYTAQKQLGKDAELSAAEIVRRAERGIGLAIRKGQEAGEIRKRSENGGRHEYRTHPVSDENKVSPMQAAQVDSKSVLHKVYEMADGVTDDQFETAIGEARAEENLSRANVVRKVKGQPKPEGKRHALLKGTHHIKPERVVRETVIALEGLAIGLGLLDREDYAVLDAEHVKEWSSSLSKSMASIHRLQKELNRVRS